jgi:hypothetical protein
VLFLTGPTLSEVIRIVLGGRDLRCAIAFWGAGAADCIRSAGGNVADTRIICDLSMGGCWPGALEELGAPDNEKLRRRDRLHAKVYISDAGMVVGSPNASANGIGFGESDPIWLEAGTFHEPKSQAWHQACTWFDSLFRSATVVDRSALAEARRNWQPTPGGHALPIREGSLLDLVREYPNRFGTLGFVFVNASATKEVKEAARRALKKQPSVQATTVDALQDEGIFTGWEAADLGRWPASFIEFWLSSRGKLSVYGRQVRSFEPITGSVFTEKKNWASIQLQFPDVPTATRVEQLDASIAAKLLADKNGGVLYSPTELRQALIEPAS